MSRLTHVILLRVVAATVIAFGLAPAVSPPSVTAEQLVVNGRFDGGVTEPWWSSENTAMRVDNGRLRVDVPGGTANVWDALAGQSGIPIVNGMAYTVAFDASASTAIPIHVRVQRETPPHAAALDEQVTLAAQSQRFEFSFTADMAASDGQVIFQLGGHAQDAAVFLDNISLVSDGGGEPGSPIEMTDGFYVWPDSNPAEWARDHSDDSRATPIRNAIASQPIARWFGREWVDDVRSVVSAHMSAAAVANKLPVLVNYNMYRRDCGGASGGGARSPEEYRTWVTNFAAGIGDRPAIVIIEPDALAQSDCVDDVRLDLLRYAVDRFAALPNTWAYLDAGNANWPGVGPMAARLPNAGLSQVRGFVVNVSNFYTTRQSIDYANALNSAMGTHAPFVVDTSRNGNGSNGEWCNPPGRRLGTPPQVGGGAEMLLWVKTPGDSDGNTGPDCDPDKPPAGTFDPDLAMELIGDGGTQPGAFPDATNTGVPPGTTLRPAGALTITEPNTVVDAMDINGCVQVLANNVTIKRSRIRCGSDYVIRLYNEFHGLLVEDVEIDGMSSTRGVAIAFRNYTVRRANIHHVSDGPRMEDNTVVEDSYIHDLADCETCHNDGIQSTGATGITIRHNTILNPDDGTSCILLGADPDPVDDAVIENNLLDGGSYTIYIGAGTTRPNAIIRDNHFGRSYLYGLLEAAEQAHVEWTGNVWHDTGEPIPDP